MTQTAHSTRVFRLAFGLAVGAYFALLVSTSRADSLDDFTGYTRPGQSEMPMGAIRPIGMKKDRDPFGSTVYFVVFDRAKGIILGDTWGTGLPELEKAFVPGRLDNSETTSRRLDTKARYLYLYQVINDSGYQSQVKTATIRLLVDPQLITSYGHFAIKKKNQVEGIGFAIDFPKDPKDPKATPGIRAISSGRPAVTDGEFRDPAPHFLAAQTYSLLPIQIANQVNPQADKGIAADRGREPEAVMLLSAVSFEGAPTRTHSYSRFLETSGSLTAPSESTTGLRMSYNRLNPPFVTTYNPYLALGTYNPYGELGTPYAVAPVAYRPAIARSGMPGAVVTETDTGTRRVDLGEEASPAIRAFWLDTPLKPGERSTLFGFTSDYPPTYDDTRLRGNVVPEVPPVGNLPDVRPANLVVDGEVPTPIAFEAETAAAGPGALGGSSLVGSLGGAPGLGGGTGGGLGGVGALGTAPSGSGGGFGGGTSGGGGGDNPQPTNPNRNPNQQAGQQAGQQTGTQAGTQIQNGGNVAVNVSQQQQQQQKQQQKQNQRQNQHQNQDCDTNNVIPEPAAIIAAALGLPALFLAARRRRRRGPDTSPDASPDAPSGV